MDPIEFEKEIKSLFTLPCTVDIAVGHLSQTITAQVKIGSYEPYTFQMTLKWDEGKPEWFANDKSGVTAREAVTKLRVALTLEQNKIGRDLYKLQLTPEFDKNGFLAQICAVFDVDPEDIDTVSLRGDTFTADVPLSLSEETLAVDYCLEDKRWTVGHDHSSETSLKEAFYVYCREQTQWIEAQSKQLALAKGSVRGKVS